MILTFNESPSSVLGARLVRFQSKRTGYTKLVFMVILMEYGKQIVAPNYTGQCTCNLYFVKTERNEGVLQIFSPFSLSRVNIMWNFHFALKKVWPDRISCILKIFYQTFRWNFPFGNEIKMRFQLVNNEHSSWIQWNTIHPTKVYLLFGFFLFLIHNTMRQHLKCFSEYTIEGQNSSFA